MSPPAIRFLARRDISEILRIQAGSREAAQWPRSAYESLEETGQKAWVAEGGEHVVGFLVARSTATEMEVLNLAVAITVRRKGIGHALLEETLSWAARNGSRQVFLEVRASNAAARQFYLAHGFVAAGVRASYYRDPADDALLLSRSVECR